ncbi:MAG: 30S ribosomal protein S24e [Promethearchaeota archaeon]
MDIEILESIDNVLLNRKEVKFKIAAEKPPDRVDVKEKIAALHNADFNLVFIKKLKTRFGKTEITGEATVYKDEDSAKIEPSYIKIRNMKKDERDAALKAEKKPKKKKKSRHKK